MLDNTLSIGYGATTGIVLTRINQDTFGSQYYGESGDMKFSLNIKHTIPPRGQAGESHMVRLDVEHYDAQGIYLRTSSAWTVIKTFDSIQSSADSSDTYDGLTGLVNSTLAGRIIGRES